MDCAILILQEDFAMSDLTNSINTIWFQLNSYYYGLKKKPMATRGEMSR